MGNKVPELKKENKYVKGTTHFQIQLCGWEFKIAAPSFVGLAMTVQVIIISYGIEAYIIKLAVIARREATKQSLLPSAILE